MKQIDKNSFIKNGYIILEDMIKPDQLSRIDASSKALMQTFKKNSVWDISHHGRNFLNNRCEKYFALNKFAKGKIVKKIAQHLLGKEKVYLFNEQLVTKAPNSKSSFSWHQDSGYVGFKHEPYISIWLAIDDSFKKNGALSIIPTKLNRNTKVLKHYWSKKTKDLHLKTNNKKTVLCEVKKGSIVVFSSLTPHSSGDNLTNKSRRAYLCQYTPFPIINKITGIQNGRALLI